MTEKLIPRDDIFLVDVLVTGGYRSRKIQIYLDGDQGVGIDECSEISRKLSALLDEKDFIKDKFTLEVSSPGLDRPLKLKRQYIKNTGKKIKVTNLENKVLKGILLSVGEEEIVIKAEKSKKAGKETEEIKIPFKEIKKTIVMVTF